MNNGKHHALSAAILFLASFFPIGSLAAGDSIRLDFRAKQISDNAPTGWEYRGKFGTKDAVFDIVRDAESGTRVLRMTADRATGVVLFDMEDIDLEKYPIMRWKWKVEVLPAGADARIKAKDDQGIAVYVGYGRLSQDSISYTWQTETKKGKTGHSTYNHIVDVDWFTLRDKNDKMDTWFEEEVNVCDDMMKFFKKIPSGWALSISSNSQYTASKADVYLDYIEFVEKKSADAKKDEKKDEKKDK